MRYMPQIYETTTRFLNYSMGSLPDVISGTVTEERNGEFYLTMQYSAYGQNADLIKVGRLITAKPNMYDDPQAFRIATIEKSLDGTMNITAYHVSYDLSKIVAVPFTANGIQAAFAELLTNTWPINYFVFLTDKTDADTFTVTQPVPMRTLLAGMEGSFLDVYGGEYKFNNWTVTLMSSRGQDRNVQIAYGKNLSAFKETDEIGAYDAVVPFAVVDDTTYYITDRSTYPTAPVVKSSTSYGYPQTLALDLSEEFDSDHLPNDTKLYNKALSYIGKNSTKAHTNLSTEYLDLTKLLGGTERVDLCDRVYISVEPYGLYNIQAKVIATEYDILTDEYTKVTIGDKKLTLADTLANLTR